MVETTNSGRIRIIIVVIVIVVIVSDIGVAILIPLRE